MSEERKTIMQSWQELLAGGGLLFLILAIRSSLRRSRDQKAREEARKLELVLLPRETIKVVCTPKAGRVILTSRRVLLETRQGFTAIPLKSIKKVRGNNEKGNRTTAIPKMVSLTIQGEQEHTIKNDFPEFEEFAKQLIKKTTKKKKP